jgi:hypothetical protein
MQGDATMKIARMCIVGISAFTVANWVVEFAPPAAALDIVSQCRAAGSLSAQEECACEAAIKTSTVEALEVFLQQYGHSDDTACTTLARVSLNRFRPDNDRDIGRPTDGSPYGD